MPSQSVHSTPHTYQEDGDPREAYVVEGNGPVVRVEPLGLARVEVLIPVDAVRLFWRQDKRQRRTSLVSGSNMIRLE